MAATWQPPPFRVAGQKARREGKGGTGLTWFIRDGRSNGRLTWSSSTMWKWDWGPEWWSSRLLPFVDDGDVAVGEWRGDGWVSGGRWAIDLEWGPWQWSWSLVRADVWRRWVSTVVVDEE